MRAFNNLSATSSSGFGGLSLTTSCGFESEKKHLTLNLAEDCELLNAELNLSGLAGRRGREGEKRIGEVWFHLNGLASSNEVVVAMKIICRDLELNEMKV